MDFLGASYIIYLAHTARGLEVQIFLIIVQVKSNLFSSWTY